MTETPPEQPSEGLPAAIRRKPSALAVAALILGPYGWIPFLGILLGGAGIVLGIVALATGAGGKRLAVGGIIAGLVCIVIGQALFGPGVLPDLGGPRETTGGWPGLCGQNLIGIGKAVAMYQTDHQDAYPPDLEVLVAEGIVSWKMLRCPVADRKMPQEPSSEKNRRCDYFYLAPSPGAPGDLLMACDYRDNHRGWRSVVYASGQATRFEEQGFQAELDKPMNEAFAAALRKAEGERQRGK